MGYSNVLSGMDVLKRFLPFDLKIFGFDHISQTTAIFSELKAANIHTIVCDTVTYHLASAQGFDAYILRSGEDSIRYAFDYVNLLQQSSASILEENQLLRRLASLNAEGETVVFSQNRKLYYSSLSKQDTAVFDYLLERLADFDTTDKFKIVKQHAGYLYRITAKKVAVRGRFYYAYFISRRIPNFQNTHHGIRYAADYEIQEEMDSSVFGIANLKAYYSQELNQALSRKSPVLILGEVGVEFLDSLWLKNEHYCKVTVFLEDGVRLRYYVCPGETLPELPEYISNLAVTYDGWYNKRTEEPFDLSQPIWEDTDIYLKYTQNQQATEEEYATEEASILRYAPLAAFVVLGVLIVAVDIRRSRKEGRHEGIKTGQLSS